MTKIRDGAKPLTFDQMPEAERGLSEHLRYALALIDGCIPAGRMMQLAAQRSIDDHRAALESDKFPWRFHNGPGMARCGFYETLPIVQGDRVGETFRLMPWQVWNTFEVWGWRSRQNNKRMRFRQSILEVAKGAGKSPLTALEALYALRWGVGGTNVISFAGRLGQARLSFNMASRILESPHRPAHLSGCFNVRKGSIECVKTGSIFEPLPATPRNLDGYVISYLLFDEAATLRNRDRLMDIITAARKLASGHTRWITTAQPASRDTLYYERRQHAQNMLEGRVEDDRLHAAIYSIDPDDEQEDRWQDERCWWKANPGLNVTQDIDMIRDALLDAKRIPSVRSSNLAKHLNVYSGSTVAWIGDDDWMACADDGLNIPDPIEWLQAVRDRGVTGKVAVGVDLAETRDLTAVALALAGSDGTLYAHVKSFAPQVALDRLPSDIRIVWDQAVEAEVLEVSDKPTTDYQFIEEYVFALWGVPGRRLPEWLFRSA